MPLRYLEFLDSILWLWYCVQSTRYARAISPKWSPRRYGGLCRWRRHFRKSRILNTLYNASNISTTMSFSRYAHSSPIIHYRYLNSYVAWTTLCTFALFCASTWALYQNWMCLLPFTSLLLRYIRVFVCSSSYAKKYFCYFCTRRMKISELVLFNVLCGWSKYTRMYIVFIPLGNVKRVCLVVLQFILGGTRTNH